MLSTPGFLGRDLGKFRAFADVWYDRNLTKDDRKVSRIIWATDYWDTINREQREIAERFVQDIEVFLGLTRTKVSFRELWESSRPSSAQELSLDKYIEKVCS